MGSEQLPPFDASTLSGLHGAQPFCWQQYGFWPETAQPSVPKDAAESAVYSITQSMPVGSWTDEGISGGFSDLTSDLTGQQAAKPL